jgi:hypothetical protein
MACFVLGGIVWVLGATGWTHPPVTEYFQSGLDGWISATVHSGGVARRFGSGDWSISTNGADPGALRLWKASLDLTDYDINFRGRINVRALGWVFRATDAGSFYGIKLLAAPPGGESSYLQRLRRSWGGEVERSQSPMPFTLAEGAEASVRVRVRGSRFETSIDGQVVDDWTDNRLVRGAIGFFSEAGESATIRWVTVTRPFLR